MLTVQLFVFGAPSTHKYTFGGMEKGHIYDVHECVCVCVRAFEPSTWNCTPHGDAVRVRWGCSGATAALVRIGTISSVAAQVSL